MGAKDLLIDAKPLETCFHGRHIQPGIDLRLDVATVKTGFLWLGVDQQVLRAHRLTPVP